MVIGQIEEMASAVIPRAAIVRVAGSGPTIDSAARNSAGGRAVDRAQLENFSFDKSAKSRTRIAAERLIAYNQTLNKASPKCYALPCQPDTVRRWHMCGSLGAKQKKMGTCPFFFS
jgi:hypothetical protein